MFLYLSKLIPVFLYPPGLTIVLLLLAGLLRKRRPRSALLLSSFAIVSLWALSTHEVSEALLRGLESQYPMVTPEQAPQADAIVVLGGYLRPRSATNAATEMNEGADRLWMGAKLFRAQKAPLVLLTGGNVPMYGDNDLVEAVAAKGLLHEWGVPLEAIEVETQSRNTHENATLSKPILAARNARRLLLVTSAFHEPRAMAIFRREGMEVTPLPTDYQTGWDKRDLIYEFMPESENLYRSSIAIREWVGLLVYKMRGWA